MPNKRQEREIKKRMKEIKEAKDNGNTRLMEQRSEELLDYLEREGILLLDAF